MNLDKLMFRLEQSNYEEKEYLQAVRKVLESIEGVVNDNPQFDSLGIIERLIEPDRIFIFKVPWLDDEGKVHVNKGYRVQFNNAIGPYKGGLRFHPSVNLSILKFLAFEQIFKNSLTSLPMGGAQGGSDFEPKGKSQSEIMRFCQSYMLELWKIIGPEIDVPGSDLGVGTREIGYLYGMYKKLSGDHTGAFTGKGLNWGGSYYNPEAGGYGTVYFAEEMLKRQGNTIEGKTVAISGFGNVAWGAALKATQLRAKVITISGPDGHIIIPGGLTPEMIDYMHELRVSNQDIVRPFSYEFPDTQFIQNKKPWITKCDIALPCAIQNELDGEDAVNLIKNGCTCVVEGANMPCTHEAVEVFQDHKILFAPGKAANAGGVAASGLEMAQNSMKMNWSAEEIDRRLQEVMRNIHNSCVKYGTENDGYINYIKGANIAGF